MKRRENARRVKTRRDPYKLQRLRQIVQLGFLVVFSFLLVRALFGTVLGSWLPLAIVTSVGVILTLVLGRVWCGWACPMGTILYWTRFGGAKKREAHLSKNWGLVKYALLVMIVAVALLGFVSPIIDWVNTNAIAASFVIVLFIVASIGLNYKSDLFWCRYLCPLGVPVTWLSKIAPMRRIVRHHCNDCSVCVDACPMGVVDPKRGFVNDPGECTVCIDCMTACTSSSTGFEFSNPLGGE
jgi:ferredoxin-type protein NapH